MKHIDELHSFSHTAAFARKRYAEGKQRPFHSWGIKGRIHLPWWTRFANWLKSIIGGKKPNDEMLAKLRGDDLNFSGKRNYKNFRRNRHE